MNTMVAGSVENIFQRSQFANQFGVQEKWKDQIELHVY